MSEVGLFSAVVLTEIHVVCNKILVFAWPRKRMFIYLQMLMTLNLVCIFWLELNIIIYQKVTIVICQVVLGD